MALGDTRSVWEQWLWEREPLRVAVAVMILVPAVVALALYPAVGAKAFVALVFCCIGAVIWLMFGIVGRKVDKVRKAVPAGDGEAVASLIVDGMWQSPGITVLRRDSLQFRPIFGQPVEVRWEGITSFREVRRFNGTRFYTKVGFWFEVPGRSRLGVALPVSAATLLRERLQDHLVASHDH
jgi:hypothetical protein